MSKILICGSRSITDKDLILRAINESKFIIDELVCGCCRGVDEISREICSSVINDIKITDFPANWTDFTEIPCKIKIDKNGRKYNCMAGPNRNRRMIDYIMPDGKVIAIWDGNSSGTYSTIKMARERGLEVFEKVVDV